MRLAPLVTLLVPAAAPAGGLLVASNAEDTVTLLDDATLRPIARFPTGSRPHEIAVSPDQRFAYVANTGEVGRGITVIDLARREVAATWSTGDHLPHDVRVSRDGELVWAACGPTRAVIELDADDGSLVRAFETGLEGGWMLAASPDDRTLFVAHLEGGAISAIDRASGTVSVHRTQPGEMGMDVAPDGAEVWVANVETGALTVLDPRADRIVASFASGGASPMRVRFTPDGKRVLVAHAEPPALVVFDRARRAPAATIRLPAAPKILTVSGDGRRAFLDSPTASLVMAVDLRGGRVAATTPVGKTPDGLAWVGEPGRYAATVAFTLPEADLVPEGIAHDPTTGTFYVGSTYRRKIVAVAPGAAPRDFTTEAQDGLLGVVGMKVDPARRVLWAAAGDAGAGMPMKGMTAGGEGRSGLWKYDLGTGKLLQRLLREGEKRFFNDLVLDASGDVYVSESIGGSVWVARGDQLAPWLADGSLPGANGVALSGDGRTLFVAVGGGLAAVDVASRRVAPIASQAPVRADGLAHHRGALVAVQPWAQGRAIVRLQLAPSRDRVVATRVLSADHPEHLQPTTGVVVGDELFYIANSQLQRFRALVAPDGSFPLRPLRPPVILRVRL
jgi:DNA-binding beta-propeller fold protein YncE